MGPANLYRPQPMRIACLSWKAKQSPIHSERGQVFVAGIATLQLEIRNQCPYIANLATTREGGARSPFPTPLIFPGALPAGHKNLAA